MKMTQQGLLHKGFSSADLAERLFTKKSNACIVQTGNGGSLYLNTTISMIFSLKRASARTTAAKSLRTPPASALGSSLEETNGPRSGSYGPLLFSDQN